MIDVWEMKTHGVYEFWYAYFNQWFPCVILDRWNGNLLIRIPHPELQSGTLDLNASKEAIRYKKYR